MSKKMDSAQLKIAEKLVVLNDRSQGMLTRIYNVKKACASVESKPRFLKEESVKSAIGHILKKFPTMDVKRNPNTYANVDQHKYDILKNLSLYYHTFAELLDLKDHILQLLTTMDANKCQLDISLNYDLTAGFLNLISNFVALMILLGRVDDRKAILGLYNAAYDLSNGRSEQSFPRLGQMILDYENPLKKLSEDFSPINRLVQSALLSLRNIYFRRNISAVQLRNAGMISLISNPQHILYAAQTETVACEYLSLETMDRWIIFGITVCHSSLLADQALEPMFNRSLENSLSLRLFRDEPLLVYPMLMGFFDGIKGYSKRVQELKQMNTEAMKNCAIFHAHRRQFIRTALRELCLLIKDQPGLLGPKILFVWMGLSLARDEVLWLLRHIDLVNVNKKLRMALENVATDRCLPELLHYMTELRQLVLQHSQIIANYYREFIASYDAIALREMIEEDASLLGGLVDNERTLIHSFIDAVARVKTHNVKLNGLRLDWYRFQANVSVLRSPFQLKTNPKFATIINTTVFHTKMIDKLNEMLRETSDLSIYCYYPDQFEAHVDSALKFPPQARYAIAFAQLAEHFAHSTHDMCPEEKDHIVERGFVCCTAVLEKISAYASRAFDDFFREEHQLVDATTPRSCAEMIYINYQGQDQQSNSSKHHQPVAREPQPLPGHESIRIGSRSGELSELERRNLYLVEILQAISHSSQINISDCVFMPKAFLHERLEFHLMKNLVQYAKPDKSAPPRRPTDVYNYLQSLMATVQRVDDCVGIDLARLFTESLLQQSQQFDCGGHYTLTSIYCEFYCEMLHRASLGQIMYSDHLKTFIPNYDAQPLPDFSPEHYTDARELRALAQLISPYGIKFINERLITMVSNQIYELFKLVRQKNTYMLLKEARKSYDRPARMREIVATLCSPNFQFQQENGSGSGTVGKKGQNASNSSPLAGASGNSPVDSILQRVTIVGGIVAFRNLLYDAVNDVLKQRMPFLMNSLVDLYDSVHEHMKTALSEVCAAAGKRTEVDQGLVNILRIKWSLPPEKLPFTPEIEEHYELCCLIIVFIAISLPQLSASKGSFFKASYVATQNNSHTIALAVNMIAGTLFYIHGREDVDVRMREFLALSSSGLIQLVHNPDQESISNHQSIYILLEQIVKHSPWLNYTLLESCLPYPLVRTAYLQCYRAETQTGLAPSGSGSAR